MSTQISKPHCCEEMEFFLQEGKVRIKYYPKFREYSISASRDNIVSQNIQFCPWCGKKLPSSLRELWFQEIFDVLHLDPAVDQDKIPEEYKSDVWWKERKL